MPRLRHAPAILAFTSLLVSSACAAPAPASEEEIDLPTEGEPSDDTADSAGAASTARRLFGDYVATGDFNRDLEHARAFYNSTNTWNGATRLAFVSASRYVSANPNEPAERGRFSIRRLENDADAEEIVFQPDRGSARAYRLSRVSEGHGVAFRLTRGTDYIDYWPVSERFCGATADCVADRGDNLSGAAARCSLVEPHVLGGLSLGVCETQKTTFSLCASHAECESDFCGRRGECTYRCNSNHRCPGAWRGAYVDDDGICSAGECVGGIARGPD